MHSFSRSFVAKLSAPIRSRSINRVKWFALLALSVTVASVTVARLVSAAREQRNAALRSELAVPASKGADQRITPLIDALACTAPPPGMVGWWPGEGDGNDIRGENNGTLQGAVTFPTGEVGHAFNFAAASNSGVIVPSSNALNPTEGITLDAWVNPSSFPNLGPAVIRRDVDSAGTTQYSLNVGDGVTTGVVHCNIGGSVGVTGGSVPLNAWSHVACTYDLQFIRAYVNGVEVASTPTTIAIPSSSQNLAIGKEDLFTNRNFDGLIDEAELFSRALDITEIQAIFAAGSAGKCRPRCVAPPSGMVGWWTGDDNPFDIWSTNHGTFESGPSPSPSPSASPYVDGKVGRAFNFDGSGSYVDLDTYSGFDLTDAITIDAWVRPTGIPSGPVVINQKGKVNAEQLGGGFEGILTKWQSSQLIGSAQPEQSGDSYGLWLASEAQPGKAAGAITPAQTGESLTLYGAVETDCGTDSVFGGTVPLNVWSHVAMTYDSNTGDLVLYVNGVLVNSVNTDCGPMDSQPSTQVNIGCQTCGSTQQPVDPFQGQIDEVEVFDRALDSSEIEAINNGASAGKCKPCLTPPPDMVGWWNGDANSNDSSISGNNGSLQGGAGYAFGKVGQAFSFDASADSGVLVPSSSALNPTDAITLDAWVNPSSYPNNAPTVIRKDTNPEATQYSLLIGDGEITGVAHCNINNTRATGGSVPLHQWTHVACTYDRLAQNMWLYVNGVLVANQEASATPIPTASGDLAIGMQGSNGGNFDGLIDEVEVFSRALSQTEIQSIVAAGASGKCKGAGNFAVTKAAKSRAGTATPSQVHPDANQTDQVGDVSVTMIDVTSPGVTDYQTFPTYQQGPMPFGYGDPLEIADISTTTFFNGDATVCFNLQSITDQTTFNQLRVLHLEGNLLINRTSFSQFSTRTLCAMTTTLSPFVISQNVNASPTAASGNIGGTITDSSGAPVSGATIILSGTESRETITDSAGHYSFDNVETNGFYTVIPSRVNYTFSPGNRSFSLLGLHTEASFTASANSGSTLSPLDTSEYFVRQQYLDFLGREPDASGFAFWTHEISSCGGDQGCVERKRINVSAAFFLSIEFQQTGYEVYRIYKAAYGNLPGAPVPIKLSEFRPDTQELGNGVIVNQTGWQTTLEANKQAFVSEFVQRARFTSLYASMNDGQFVDTLNQNAGFVLSQSERDQLVSALSTQAKTRAAALRSVAENAALAQQEFNQAFVLMQYFGYLRRNPNDAPDGDFSGYNFWLNKLNTFNGNFQDAEMVKAFLVSGEYSGRFPR